MSHGLHDLPKLDFSNSPVNLQLTSEQKLGFYRQMSRIRRFEQAALKSYNAGKMGGFLHLYIGQESVAVATLSLCGEHDHVITAYRDHGHALAAGMSMNECMAELFGKLTGCSQGKGGSMHFFAPDKNFWGGHGIVAGQTPLGLGLAYAINYLDLPGCALTFLGDGAINQGAFHESLNLAALFDLPAVFIIENNGYSMGTSMERSSAYRGCLAQRAEAYDMEWDLVNGEDVYETRAKTHLAMERARRQRRPTLLEIFTYRYYGHSIADAQHKKYRTPEEIERYKRDHDPLALWRRRLADEGVLTDAQADAIDAAARDEAAAAVRFADESPPPAPADITRHVYWEVDHATPSAGRGRHLFD